MVKFEREETEKAKRAIASLQKAKENGTSNQIEHLQSHRGNMDLKYDWNNLFWACAHCNNIKLDTFEPILDLSLIHI